MSISGCEKRPSLVTAVTASFNVLSEPFRSSLFALPKSLSRAISGFRPVDHKAPMTTRQDPQIQILSSYDASRTRPAYVDHKVLRQEIPHFRVSGISSVQEQGGKRNQPQGEQRATRGARTRGDDLAGDEPISALNQRALREPVENRSFPALKIAQRAIALRAWCPRSSQGTERWTERTLITIIAQLHPRQFLLM